MKDDDRIAPSGSLWVCMACGKTAEDRYGIEGYCTPGWDESCMLNSGLFKKSLIVYGDDGRVVKIKETNEDSSIIS